LRIFRPAVKPFGELYFLRAKRIAMRGRGILLVRRAVADDAVDDNECVSGSGSFGPHWDLMMQCLSKCVESPLKSDKRLKGRAVPRSLSHYFNIPVP
jgi:hypothetical protein